MRSSRRLEKPTVKGNRSGMNLMKHSLSNFRRLVYAPLLASLALFAAIMVIPGAVSAKTKPLNAKNLPFLAGGDISLLTWEEQHGQVYKDNGKPADLLTLLKAHGWNCMRLRLWVNPTGKGIFVNDLPYSDTWADPGKQYKPAAWKDLPFDQLVAQVQSYTKDVIATMRRGGAMPDIVQIGNEITPGMLWPDGRDYGTGHDFTNLGKLLKAGIAGMKEGSGKETPPLVMIHIDRG